MLEVTNLVTPSPDQFEVVIRGMRSPLKSWDKSDSGNKLTYEVTREDCYNCSSYYSDNKCYKKSGELCGLIIGKKDKQLLLNLCKAGDPSHRKVLRQLPVIMDITAPLYWWKQMDKYQIGTVTNAESTMHTMTKEPFKIEDFSVNNFLSIDGEETNWLECNEYEDYDMWFGGLEYEGQCMTPEEYFQEYFVSLLNSLRVFYLKTNNRKYWHAINELLPQSYMQTRTWSGNYEVLLNIINQRAGHKLSEWQTFSDYMLENVPYLKDIYEAIKKEKRYIKKAENPKRTFISVWER